MDIQLPYVDRLLSKLEEGDRTFIDELGLHMHWGYWAEEDAPDASLEGYREAADRLAVLHFEMADIRPGDRVLDVGCGFGGAIALLNERMEGLEIAGLNIDPRQIHWARETVLPRAKAANRISFHVGNACALPYAPASFDVVYAIECIFHFPHRGIFLSEARRVLRPGGKLVISDFVVFGPAIPLMLAVVPFFRLHMKAVYGNSTSALTKGIYQRMADRRGFHMTAIRDITSNTLPTYEVMKAFNEPLDDRSTKRANQFIEWTSRLRLFRYMLFLLSKPDTEPTPAGAV